MKIINKINEWMSLRKELGRKTLGFVPTMGNLHEGHLSLCARAKAENDISVASIFINPTQFNQTQDFQSYPRTLEQDVALLSELKIDYLLLPDAKDIYPDNYAMRVSETELSLCLEGEYRPGHFTGMLTVVLKLLNLAKATRAYFGEKDYQQLLLIKKMAQAFFIDTEIMACETLRASDGLALSSRNNRLNAEQREKASHFPKLLHSTLAVEEIAIQLILLGFRVDYIKEEWQRRLGAVWIDDIRLIDNIPL